MGVHDRSGHQSDSVSAAPGVFTHLADQALQRSAEWHVPMLWRSEFCSVLLQHLRQDLISLDVAQDVLQDALRLLQDREHAVDQEQALTQAAAYGLSAYDAEFVVLAETLQCPLVTSDRKLVSQAGHVAVLLSSFVA